ncbi:hypothetical protein H0H93_004485 [Arthromyces matolae]|nr:hypothetical protein H0H93_004485 [Arthromyces matolae]
MPSKKRGNHKRLRQTTLFESSPKASPTSSKLSSSRGKRKHGLPVELGIHSSDSDDDEGLSSIKFESTKHNRGSDDDSVIGRAPKRRKTVVVDSDDEHPTVLKKPRKIKVSSRASEQDDASNQPRRRKLKKKRDVALVSSTDDEDLAEEVEEEHILETRLRTRNRKTAFQKNLEKLKRRKQGKPTDSSASSSGEEDTRSDDNHSPFEGARQSSDFDSLFDEDSEAHSSDFIVEDDNSVVATLPVEFSMETHEGLDHQFKKIFQFFVHIAVRPAKERHYFMEDQLNRT